MIVIVLLAFIYLRYKKREDWKQQYALAARNNPDKLLVDGFYQGPLRDIIEQSSGSGSGLPLLVSCC